MLCLCCIASGAKLFFVSAPEISQILSVSFFDILPAYDYKKRQIQRTICSGWLQKVMSRFLLFLFQKFDEIFHTIHSLHEISNQFLPKLEETLEFYGNVRLVFNFFLLFFLF